MSKQNITYCYSFNFPRDETRHHCPSVSTISSFTARHLYSLYFPAFVKNNQSRVSSVLFNLRKNVAQSQNIPSSNNCRNDCIVLLFSVRAHFIPLAPLYGNFILMLTIIGGVVPNEWIHYDVRNKHSFMHCLIAVVVDYIHENGYHYYDL